MAIACNSFTSGGTFVNYDYGRLAMKLQFKQHDKSYLCRYMVVCNPINDVAEKILGTCTCRSISKYHLKFTFFNQLFSRILNLDKT